MKFELKPNNRGLTDKELLDDLRTVAHQLKKDYVTQAEYDKCGRLCAATIKKRFKSWCKAHELAGLRRIRNYQATGKDCIDDLKRVAALLKTDCITTADYDKHGKFSLPLISRRAGSWKVAVEKAGLKISSLYNEKITDEELFKNLEQLWEKLGRQPTRKDFIRPFSIYAYGVYPKRFGTYRKALEAFVASFENQVTESNEQEEKPPVDYKKSKETSLHKTSRNISWRLRFLVMRRDNFKCCQCGRSPSTEFNVVLEIDHIKPWASGGETTMDNLQTLCKWCNGGKSNLPQTVIH